jgi:hypothetical protein
LKFIQWGHRTPLMQLKEWQEVASDFSIVRPWANSQNARGTRVMLNGFLACTTSLLQKPPQAAALGVYILRALLQHFSLHPTTQLHLNQHSTNNQLFNNHINMSAPNVDKPNEGIIGQISNSVQNAANYV